MEYYPAEGWSRVEFHRDPCWVYCCFSSSLIYLSVSLYFFILCFICLPEWCLIVYINDWDLGLLSSILKFADDTKVFGKAATPTDRLQLQQLDLNELCRWADEWHIKFNVSKCKVMHTELSNNNYLYSMNGQTLNEVAELKDLGIMISSDLNVANHCQHACSKGNKMLGLIKRAIKHKNITVMVQLYTSLVRPHFEYCSPACSPHYSKDKAMLERVRIQHRFTKALPRPESHDV